MFDFYDLPPSYKAEEATTRICLVRKIRVSEPRKSYFFLEQGVGLIGNAQVGLLFLFKSNLISLFFMIQTHL